MSFPRDLMCRESTSTNQTRLPWKERWTDRAMGEQQRWVELIVLEEVWLKMRYFAGGLSPFEYRPSSSS